MVCAQFSVRPVPGGTRRSLGLRRDGQVDKGGQVVSARHGSDEGPRAPLGGVETVEKGEQVVSGRARAERGAWVSVKNGPKSTKGNKAASGCSGSRQGETWVGIATLVGPTRPPSEVFFITGGTSPRAARRPRKRGVSPSGLPLFGGRGPPAFAGAGSAFVGTTNRRVNARCGRGRVGVHGDRVGGGNGSGKGRMAPGQAASRSC